MRITVFHNSNTKSVHTAADLIAKLKRAGFLVVKNNPEIVITVGGDGTLLSAFHEYAHMLDRVRFIGVHTGHLGFYTDWRDYELDELVASLKGDGSEQIISYPLLDVGVRYAGDNSVTHYLALNESTLKRVSATMVTDVYIRDELFESFRGDGLCISTPTGSTAYNKSIGGAVLHPRLEAIQLAEIASINNRVFRTLSAPVVIAPDEWIDLYPDPKGKDDYVMTVDRFVPKKRLITAIRYRIAKQRISFAGYRHTHFWNRVEDAFIGEKQHG
ncbi:NAD kinase [Loigolactobacillus coryniformis]|jgi:NAD+ kinase|uniref:NAD kinase n=2 Tax=Loigolactobacillus coryniformis TaxID=1610 RepID=J3JBF2_9LACO|nr:NAD kinase [Loigolactobacillus coryniformis]ATO44271.1 NAD kinase [Loigolactobacillus coryniformis subsp. torquens DSM 20004 = KCTC 3535]EJN55669.1 Putative inorganic polyphosphate/ATP-NAD kinase [Loigolactobacillus coryniformis subsp. coryniformis CECT 5711]KRK77386.1 inorganic polyphosphate ATP-NAD kinase [Loigolactobacillus coryniformis subsp. torquens DSM 20004 = KCTC 3535]MCL5459081.1 NAD kinase [Loigolactobacillus coryniformis]